MSKNVSGETAFLMFDALTWSINAGVPVRTYFDIEIGLLKDEDVEKYYHNIISME